MKSSAKWLVVSGRFALMTLIGALPMAGGILPDRLAGAMKSDLKTVAPPDAALFDEYGFDAAEQGTFGPSIMTAWRFRDSTGAMAAFQYLRPADAKPLKTTVNQAAVKTPKGATFEYGNYVIQVTGKVPADDELAQVYLALPKVQQAPLPVLATFLPPADLIPNSERYIIGPVGLDKFDPKIPPSVAAFHLSAEAQYGRYRGKNGDFSLAIFEYPTPGMARQKVEEFEKLPGLMAKRSGPLVAVVADTADRDAAERLLAKISYEAIVTVNEKGPNHEVRSFGRTILNYIAFAGLIMLFCILSGLLFAGARILARRLGPKDDDGAMITLHLEGNE